MNVEIHELASKEFDDAIEWYEMQSKGLGIRFKRIVINQIRKIRQNPGWFLVETDAIYKAYIPKFPYKVLYTFDNERIIIWAIAHMHRKPWYWQLRVR
ncbi:MAG: type II toxin-antitoxin system RelE/ParE family toxin [Desulfobulbaceae bacterium]|jgi:plasmid stabilization system protein ParE|nr:type II toxin-antitoxin system RelE/ParE family toxin [Desulfobulbaceae bacterium]